MAVVRISSPSGPLALEEQKGSKRRLEGMVIQHQLSLPAGGWPLLPEWPGHFPGISGPLESEWVGHFRRNTHPLAQLPARHAGL